MPFQRYDPPQPLGLRTLPQDVQEGRQKVHGRDPGIQHPGQLQAGGACAAADIRNFQRA